MDEDETDRATIDPRVPLPVDVSYENALAALIASENMIRETCQEHMARKSLTNACLFGFGIVSRALAVCSGFRSMVQQQNSLCALPLVRMHLDTVLRLYAGFWVGDHQTFCLEVLKGVQINRMKDANGLPMTDKALVEKLAIRNPWIPNVYKRTSGYIHFSGRHIRSVMHVNNQRSEAGLYGQCVIGPTDYNREPAEFCEPISCMHHLNLILDFALRDWFVRMCRPDGHVPNVTEVWGDYDQQPEG